MASNTNSDQEPGPKIIRSNSVVRSVSFSPDGETIALASYDRTVRLYSTKGLQLLRIFKGHGLSADCAVFSPNGKLLATGGRDGVVKLWDPLVDQDDVFAPGVVNGLAFSPDGCCVVTAGFSGLATLWNVTTQREMKSFVGHSNGILDVAFSADGRHIATASRDKTAKLWDVVTGKNFKHIAAVYHVAFSPNGRSLATACEDGLVRLWDLSTGKELLTLKGHHSPPRRLAFFPDGRRLATGSGDNTVKLWNLETRQEMLSVRHGALIRALAVSADGRKLASAAANQVKVWLTNEPSSAANAKTNRLRELTGDRESPKTPALDVGLTGWRPEGIGRDRYEVAVDRSTRHSGQASVLVKSEQASTTEFAGIGQGIAPNAYRGKRVRLSAYLKAERVRGHAGLWMRVDGLGHSLNFDNMSSRPILGTTDWKRYEITLDVPEDSSRLVFGFLLHGQGQLWADDFELEIVGPEVPATGAVGYRETKRAEFMRLNEEERRIKEQQSISMAYTLPLKPLNMSFEGAKR